MVGKKKNQKNSNNFHAAVPGCQSKYLMRGLLGDIEENRSEETKSPS
jgi:hypothetical protein